MTLAVDASHWSVLSNDLNLDILPLEQERREEEPPAIAAQLLVVGGAAAVALFLALALLVAVAVRRARPATPPSPSYQRGQDYQIPPHLSPLPEPSLFPAPAPAPLYSTVGRPRSTVRPATGPLPPELRLGWPPGPPIPSPVREGEAPRSLATLSREVAREEGREDRERTQDWPFYG